MNWVCLADHIGAAAYVLGSSEETERITGWCGVKTAFTLADKPLPGRILTTACEKEMVQDQGCSGHGRSTALRHYILSESPTPTEPPGGNRSVTSLILRVFITYRRSPLSALAFKFCDLWSSLSER